MISDRIRGIPAGIDSIDGNDLAALMLHPADGRMGLPVLTIDRGGFGRNVKAMQSYVTSNNAQFAPHAKTHMAPALGRSIIAGGAWGISVADVRQAAVMLRGGVRRILLANEVGGIGGARRLANLVARFSDCEVFVFVDSIASVDALVEAFAGISRPIQVLVEVGTVRAGARSSKMAIEIVEHILQTSTIRLAGVSTYEGAISKASLAETFDAVDALLEMLAAVYKHARSRLGPDADLIVSAGGSLYFDKVVAFFAATIAEPKSSLVLRSGTLLFGDHGTYAQSLKDIDLRSGFSIDGALTSMRESFVPVLSLWAEVLSQPEPDLAICGLGMRDVAHDQGLPIALDVYRDGEKRSADLDVSRLKPLRLNDQHCYLQIYRGADIRVGDVIRFGIKHPCTTLQLHRFVFSLDEGSRVEGVIETEFG